MKDFNKFQQEAIRTAVYPDVGWNLYYPALGLASEAGEVCGKIKKIMRDKRGAATKVDTEDISSELGDVLWYISQVALDNGWKMSDIAQTNIDKLESRKIRNLILGQGDNR